MEIKKAMAIVNPHSGKKGGMKRYKELVKWRDGAAKEAGIKLDIFLTNKSEERNATNLAKRAVKEGYDLILVVGGDGTVNEVANGVVGSNIPLLVVRAGNGNDFARANGSPEDVGEALDLIFHGEVRSVDLMEVNGRVCVNIFGFGGIDARAVEYVEGTLRKKCGFMPIKFLYFVSLIRELFRFKIKYPYLKLEVQERGLPARSMEGKVSLFAVANGPTCGGIFRINPGADVSDGLSEVCWVKKTSRFRILVNIIRALNGTHLCLPEVETLPDGTLPRLNSLTVSSSEPLVAQMDGEIIPANKEFKIAVIPQALKVLVPPSLIAAQRPLMIRELKTPEFQPSY